MHRSSLLFMAILLFNHTSFSQATPQSPIEVAQNTLKINALGQEFFYYAFAEGDQLIFNFEELNGKELKELEIIEMPGASKFMDYKSKKIENKTINILRTAIYKFRFANSSLAGRICRIKIQRIPGSETTRNFNTGVYWRTIYDTTYTVEPERYLVKSDTTVINLKDFVGKVHSQLNANGAKSIYNFTLPENTISWGYYVGVDQAGQEAYEKATQELASKAGPIASKFTGYGPLAALALGGLSYLAKLQKGEDVDVYFMDGQNVSLFQANQSFRPFVRGKVINDFSSLSQPLSGNFFVGLSNDNAMTSVLVTVKITAITVNEEWATRPVQKAHIIPREEPYVKN